MQTTVDLIRDPTEAAMRAYYSEPVDLADCEREPLHRIQVIQPHACLLVADAETYVIDMASENTDVHLGRPWRELLGATLESCFDESLLSQIRRGVKSGGEQRRPLLLYIESDGQTFGRQVLYHLAGPHLILEVEPAQEGAETSVFQQRLGAAIEEVQQLTNYATMFQDITDVVARISGYDRVMLYRFDADYNGVVVAERCAPDAEPYLNLRYPASDIPKQARELYLINRVRMLSDVVAPQVFIRQRAPENGSAASAWDLDLSLADCRGLSPVHREYLQNIGVEASMSIAIVLDGRLWGLFALHHQSPRYLDFELRAFLRFLGQVFSGHLALQTASEYRRRVLEVNVNRSRLGDQISEQQDIGAALTTGSVTILDVVPEAQGSAVCAEGTLNRVGRTPPNETLDRVIDYVKRQKGDPLVFSTDRLGALIDADPEALNGCAGMLLVWLDLSRGEYIAWFREEIVRQIDWGGKPEKSAVETSDGGVRYAPRKSFAKYSETVSGRCEPWSDADVDAALAMRSHIKDVVLRRYHQVKRVNAELASAYQEMENFSYTVSHDLRAPLRGINGFAEILLEDYGERLDDDGRHMLHLIQKSTVKMNLFINDLLHLARLGTQTLQLRPVDVAAMSRELFDDLIPAFPGRRVDFVVGEDLPIADADHRLLSVALSNIITNAIKYSDNRELARIEVGYEFDEQDGRSAYFVRDNGQGFEQRYADRIFEMFTRLSEDGKIDGTGVGLALVQRVIQKHGGEIWVRSKPNEGAVFYFTLRPE